MKEVGADVIYVGKRDWTTLKQSFPLALAMMAAGGAGWYYARTQLLPDGLLRLSYLGVIVLLVLLPLLCLIGAAGSDIMLHSIMNQHERIALRVDETLAQHEGAVPVEQLWIEAFRPGARAEAGAVAEQPAWFVDYMKTALAIGEISSDDGGKTVSANDQTRQAVWARRHLRAQYYDTVRRGGRG